jgi:hypothetical protein
VILFIALSIFNSPGYAWRILRYGQSDIRDAAIFPERIIENGPTYSIIERGMRVLHTKWSTSVLMVKQKK